MAEDYKQKIESILNKKNSKNRMSINFLGKYYLTEELNKRGYISELKEGYCIITTNKNKNLKIKVRASRFKDEKLFKIGKEYIKFWGWAIEMKGKKKENFDFFICVSLDDSWKKPRFYIFSHDEINSIEYCNKNLKWQYGTIKKALTWHKGLLGYIPIKKFTIPRIYVSVNNPKELVRTLIK